MKKSPRSTQWIADLVHKGFIWGCIGLTAYGFALGGLRVYRYMNVTRPQRQAVEDNLLKEEPHFIADSEELKS